MHQGHHGPFQRVRALSAQSEVARDQHAAANQRQSLNTGAVDLCDVPLEGTLYPFHNRYTPLVSPF